MIKNTGNKFEEFIEIIKILRKKCPWDREQTLESLKPYLVEEVYEAISAIDDKDYRRLNEEIGDMLLHVVMLSVFLSEKTKYSIDEVIRSISEKMVRRHPHVFSKGKAKTKEEVWGKWEKIKREEGRDKGAGERGMLESIPKSLPALYRAEKVQRRAARVGFDWDHVAGAWDKVHEELEEVHEIMTNASLGSARDKQCQMTNEGKIKLKEEIGDLLFAIVNVARKLDLDPEDTLQKANDKFMRRFGKIEKKLQKKKLTLSEMDALWEKAKASES